MHDEEDEIIFLVPEGGTAPLVEPSEVPIEAESFFVEDIAPHAKQIQFEVPQEKTAA